MNEYYKTHWLQFYSRVAASYDFKVKLFAALMGGERSFHNACRSVLRLQPSANLLDMCCGTGSLAIELSNTVLTDGYVCGIDLCPEMIARAESKNNKRAVFRLLDAMQTDFADSYFDAVTIVAALHEMPREQRMNVLREAFRLLKPEGRLLVGEHFVSGNPLHRFLQKAIFRAISKPPERITFKDMIQRNLSQEIMDSGFQVENTQILPLRLFHIIIAVKPDLTPSPSS